MAQTDSGQSLSLLVALRNTNRRHRRTRSGRPERDPNMVKKKVKQEVLPNDMVNDILVNLPVKTLIKFRSVSKPWSSLISHPYFQQDHYRLRLQRGSLLLLAGYEFDEVSRTATFHLSTHDSNTGAYVDDFSFTVPYEYLMRLWLYSCRGLVCISDVYAVNILLCNPATREIISVPTTESQNYNIGFGYAASTKQFKVVRFFDPDSDGSRTKYSCQVFTLGTSEWRDAKPPPYQGPYACGVPFLHGSIHLLPLPYHLTVDKCIHAFDVQTEEYTSVLLPESYRNVTSRENYMTMTLTEIRGSLCLNFYFCFNSPLEIWFLKDYDGGEWVKQYTINRTSLPSFVWGEVLTSMKNGSTLLMTISQREPNSDQLLYYYYLPDETFTHTAKRIKKKYSATLYVESLLSLQALCNHGKSTVAGIKHGAVGTSANLVEL